MIQKFLKTGLLRLGTYQRENLRKKHHLTYLFWECTLRCNFNCLHCGSNAKNKNYKGELTTQEIKNIFKQISLDFNPQDIMLAITGGEPLLRKDLFEVMQYASDLGFSWGMVTNGYLINPEIVNKLKNAGMKTVVVSIDGIDKTHDSFRKINGSYKRSINAVKLLAKENFLKNLQITSSIFPGNINQLEEMYSTFLKLGINSWRLFNVDSIGRAENNNNLLLDAKQLRQLIEFIKEKRKQSKNIEITYGCAGFLGPDFEYETRGYPFYCTAGINTASILFNGDIFVCPNVPRQKDLIQGNVRQDNFAQVWNNKFEFFRNKNRTSCKKCKACEYWEECLGNSLHLWDFKKNQPKMCHMEMLNKTK